VKILKKDAERYKYHTQKSKSLKLNLMKLSFDFPSQIFRLFINISTPYLKAINLKEKCGEKKIKSC
jgi:hypothetical protein